MYRNHYDLHYVLAASFLRAASVAAPAQDPFRYAVINVGDPGGTGIATAHAINNLGVVVGITNDAQSGDLEAFVWDNGEYRYLEGLGFGDRRIAYDINDRGDVVGRDYDENIEHRAVLWPNGGPPVDLGTLGGTFARAYGVNRDGHVVGDSGLAGGGANPFRWIDGQMEALGDFGLADGFAMAINDRDQVVGAVAGSGFSGVRAFLWENGELINLGSLLSNRRSFAYDVNETEVIAGYGEVLDSTARAVIWRNRSIINIHNDNIGIESFAYGINDSDQVVGGLVVDDLPLDGRAFLYEGSGPMVRLDSLLPPRLNWSKIELAFDINNAGEIVGRGYRTNGGSSAFLVTPVRPTLTLQGPQPGRAGTLNGLRVTGCTPGARIIFYYSTHGGGTLVPGCNHTDGVTLQLDDPIQIGSAVANQNGIATLTRFVPTGARNLGDVLIQAVQQNGCRISQLVVKRFE